MQGVNFLLELAYTPLSAFEMIKIAETHKCRAGPGDLRREPGPMEGGSPRFSSSSCSKVEKPCLERGQETRNII